MPSIAHPGIAASLAAALLFGAGAPFAKLLLESADPWLLAGLLYLGSGLGLAIARILAGERGAASWFPPQVRRDVLWLGGAVICGGVLGPLLLMVGLSRLPASHASLLLNAEAVFTALLAWFAFRENVDRRIALGMAFIVAGGVLLAWPGQAGASEWWPSLCVVAACLAWAVDNNLTRKVALADASWIAMVKGLAAGATNLVLALAVGGAAWPSPRLALGAAAIGFASYGLSLVLYVIGLRQLGTARTGAYFGVAPFFGALLSIAVLGEALSPALAAAGALMAAGVWLHLTERHVHWHVHEATEHEHEHVHGAGDEHHDHAHEPAVAPGTRHSHRHVHEPIAHSHPHYPDAHHRHRHG